MQLGIFEGEVYELDGKFYKIKKAPYIFQEIKEDGSKEKFRAMDVEYDAGKNHNSTTRRIKES